MIVTIVLNVHINPGKHKLSFPLSRNNKYTSITEQQQFKDIYFKVSKHKTNCNYCSSNAPHCSAYIFKAKCKSSRNWGWRKNNNKKNNASFSEEDWQTLTIPFLLYSCTSQLHNFNALHIVVLKSLPVTGHWNFILCLPSNFVVVLLTILVTSAT